MKATKIKVQTSELAIQEATKIELPEVKLLSTEDIARIFAMYDTSVTETLEHAKSIVVNSEDTLVIAENSSATVNGLIKTIEKVRKDIGEPYFQIKKEIDAKSKSYMEPLEKAKELYNERILAYRQLQKAQKSREAEKKQEEILKVDREKKEESERILRIKRMISAKLYGGSYTKKNGGVRTAPGCQVPKDCDALMTTVEENFPDIESFMYFKDEANKAKAEIESKIMLHKADLVKLGSTNEKQRNEAYESINVKRVDESVKLRQEEDKSAKTIQKETAKEIRTWNSEVQEAGKGIRRVVTYELLDITKIPEKYLVLDTAKVEEFKNNNLGIIKESLDSKKDMELFIPGIRFLYQESYTAR